MNTNEVIYTDETIEHTKRLKLGAIQVNVIPAAAQNYLHQVKTRLQKVLGGHLVALYLCGSAGFGDFLEAESDFDLIAVTTKKLKHKVIQRISSKLAHDSLPCPVAGMELYIVQKKFVTSPVKYPSYEMLMRTGATWGLEVWKYQYETDLLIDLSICRQFGQTLLGRPLAEWWTPIPHDWLIYAMYQSLSWRQRNILHPFHDPQGENAVLNACRAWRYKVENCFCSKTDAGQWATAYSENVADQELISQALEIRQGVTSQPLDSRAVKKFVKEKKYALQATFYHRLLAWLRNA